MKEIGPVFLAGLVMVVLGAVTVLMFAPHASPAGGSGNGSAGYACARQRRQLAMQRLQQFCNAVAATPAAPPSGFFSWVWRLLAIALAIVSWGAYGPTLHKGQAAMHHSRLRALMCVGLAYFAIAVVVPDMILAECAGDEHL